MAGDLSFRDPEVFEDLFHLDTLRGKDSSGMLLVYDLGKEDKQKDGVLKAVGEPRQLYNKYNKLFTKDKVPSFNLNIILGHNRAATQGSITEANAHPFDFDNLVGAHNGTIQKWSMRDFKGFKDFDVDSQILYSHLDRTDDLQYIWDNVDGAMALTWWNRKNNTIHFARNGERPLHYCFSEDGKKVYWASEAWMLSISLGRNGQKHTEIRGVEENTLHTFTFDDKRVPTLSTSPLNPKKAVTYNYGNDYDYVEWWKKNGKGHKEKKGGNHVVSAIPLFKQFFVKDYQIVRETPSLEGFVIGETLEGEKIRLYTPNWKPFNKVIEEIEKDPEQLYEVKNPFKVHNDKEGFTVGGMWQNAKPIENKFFAPGFNGAQLSMALFLTHCADGCSYCAKAIKWEDKDKIIWVDKISPVCETCGEYEDVRTIITS
jgi:hypothetical protein